MSNERDNDIIELEFTNKIDAGDASVYGKLPKGINWIMDENMNVIGITFNVYSADKYFIRRIT